MNVPWANNKKKTTVLGKDIIWVHNETSADEGSDPERFIKTVVEALTLGGRQSPIGCGLDNKRGMSEPHEVPRRAGSRCDIWKE